MMKSIRIIHTQFSMNSMIDQPESHDLPACIRGAVQKAENHGEYRIFPESAAKMARLAL
ncbi:MAG: hypothetical protein LKF50_08915 [Solobacterium sp.]|jgi:hypothetical protein|nr:hypothetical protein [Solobacterium sp.]